MKNVIIIICMLTMLGCTMKSGSDKSTTYTLDSVNPR